MVCYKNVLKYLAGKEQGRNHRVHCELGSIDGLRFPPMAGLGQQPWSEIDWASELCTAPHGSSQGPETRAQNTNSILKPKTYPHPSITNERS